MSLRTARRGLRRLVKGKRGGRVMAGTALDLTKNGVANDVTTHFNQYSNIIQVGRKGAWLIQEPDRHMSRSFLFFEVSNAFSTLMPCSGMSLSFSSSLSSHGKLLIVYL